MRWHNDIYGCKQINRVIMLYTQFKFKCGVGSVITCQDKIKISTKGVEMFHKQRKLD